MSKVSRTFDFTYFYKDKADFDVQIAKWANFDVARLVIGDETTKEGRKHLQGKVTWTRSYRCSAVAKLIPGYHVEASIVKDDFNYAMKERIVLNIDNRKQGSRTDIKGCMSLVKAKKPRLELMETHPAVMARYEPFMVAYAAELQAYEGERVVIWAYGETGSGKSRVGHASLPDAAFVNFKNGFINGYRGEGHVIMDDFRAHDLHFSELLKLLDRYPYTANVKNGSVRWNASVIYITSCWRPEDVYKGCQENVQQLKRRLAGVYKFPQDADTCRGHLWWATHRETPAFRSSPASEAFSISSGASGFDGSSSSSLSSRVAAATPPPSPRTPRTDS